MYGDQCGEFVSRFWACKGLERFSYDLDARKKTEKTNERK